MATKTVDLAALKQREAAWLLDVGTRSLRDLHVPRNPDGSYDGRELVKFAARRLPVPKFSDAEAELLERVKESFTPDDPCIGLLTAFDGLDAAHGDAGSENLDGRVCPAGSFTAGGKTCHFPVEKLDV